MAENDLTPNSAEPNNTEPAASQPVPSEPAVTPSLGSVEPSVVTPSESMPEPTPVVTPEPTITPAAPVAAPDQPTDVPSQPATVTPTVMPSDSTPATTSSPVVSGLPSTPVVSGSQLASQQGQKKRKLTLLVSLVAGLVVLLGGGAAAYYKVYLPNQPQSVIKQGMTNLISKDTTKSLAFEGDVSVSGKNVPAGLKGVSFQGGASDNGAITATGDVDLAVTKVTLDLRSVDGKDFYVKIGGLNGLDKVMSSLSGQTGSTFAQYAPLIAQVNDQWYIINQSLVQQLTKSAAPTDQRLGQADAKKVGEAYKHHQFVTVVKTLPDASIHGMASKHYQIGIDKTKFKAFLTEVKDDHIPNVTIDDSTLNSADKIDTSKDTYEIWVDKGGKRLDQLQVVAPDKDTTTTFRIALYDFNKPVNVQKPDGAKSILELLGAFLGGTTGGTQLNSLQDGSILQ